MTKWFVTFATVAVMTSFAPALSMAQGVGVEVPGVGGVRIGEPDRYREDSRLRSAASPRGPRIPRA